MSRDRYSSINQTFVKGRVLKEILSPEFGEDLPKSLIPRLVFKYRRWKGSAWKHELCFSCSASFMERKMRFYARINRAGLDAYDKVANYR